MTFGFIFYWLVSFVFLSIGFYFNVSAGGIEFFRIWLKPLFILNFSWFVVIEIAFSLIYWTSFLLLNIIPLATPAILFLNGHHTEDPGLTFWICYSLIIYIIVMSPYFFLQYRLSFYFKRTIFKKLASSINATSIRFHGQSANLNLDQNLFTQLAARSGSTKQWVEDAIQDFKSKPGKEDKRFSVSIRGTDQMSWKINGVRAKFFEAVIDFDGEKKQVDRDGSVSYESYLTEVLFDGVVIVAEGILREPWRPTVFETERVFVGREKKNRPIHRENPLIMIYNALIYRIFATKSPASHENTLIEQFVEPKRLKLQSDSLFQFILCEQTNLYLFIKTELEGTAFDLNTNIPVSKSIDLFKQDLDLVKIAMNEISKVLTIVEGENESYSKDVA